jgi:hypothetical protein
VTATVLPSLAASDVWWTKFPAAGYVFYLQFSFSLLMLYTGQEENPTGKKVFYLYVHMLF